MDGTPLISKLQLIYFAKILPVLTFYRVVLNPGLLVCLIWAALGYSYAWSHLWKFWWNSSGEGPGQNWMTRWSSRTVALDGNQHRAQNALGAHKKIRNLRTSQFLSGETFYATQRKNVDKLLEWQQMFTEKEWICPTTSLLSMVCQWRDKTYDPFSSFPPTKHSTSPLNNYPSSSVWAESAPVCWFCCLACQPPNFVHSLSESIVLEMSQLFCTPGSSILCLSSSSSPSSTIKERL